MPLLHQFQLPDRATLPSNLSSTRLGYSMWMWRWQCDYHHSESNQHSCWHRAFDSTWIDPTARHWLVSATATMLRNADAVAAKSNHSPAWDPNHTIVCWIPLDLSRHRKMDRTVKSMAGAWQLYGRYDHSGLKLHLAIIICSHLYLYHNSILINLGIDQVAVSNAYPEHEFIIE